MAGPVLQCSLSSPTTRASFTALPRSGAGPALLSAVYPVRGGASSAQPLDINSVPGSSPDQGHPHGLCCNTSHGQLHRPLLLHGHGPTRGPPWQHGPGLKWQGSLPTSSYSSQTVSPVLPLFTVLKLFLFSFSPVSPSRSCVVVAPAVGGPCGGRQASASLSS